MISLNHGLDNLSASKGWVATLRKHNLGGCNAREKHTENKSNNMTKLRGLKRQLM